MTLKKVYAIAISLIWILVLFWVLISSIDTTPFRLKQSKKAITNYFTPQGWGFFTRNPREEHITIYLVNTNTTIQKVTQPNFSPKNRFGLSRTNRVRQMELAKHLSDLNIEWRECSETMISNCKLDTTYTAKSTNLLNGIYYIKKTKTIPWAWSKSNLNNTSKYNVIKVDFR